jgi:bacillithiol system protein YtxJ
MQWTELISEEQLGKVVSGEKDVLLFKHSTTCSISAAALSRLERYWNSNETNHVLPCYLDLKKYRQLSNTVAERFGVVHESPQVLLIRNGRVLYHESHMAIQYSEILKLLKS